MIPISQQVKDDIVNALNNKKDIIIEYQASLGKFDSIKELISKANLKPVIFELPFNFDTSSSINNNMTKTILEKIEKNNANCIIISAIPENDISQFVKLSQQVNMPLIIEISSLKEDKITSVDKDKVLNAFNEIKQEGKTDLEAIEKLLRKLNAVDINTATKSSTPSILNIQKTKVWPKTNDTEEIKKIFKEEGFDPLVIKLPADENRNSIKEKEFLLQEIERTKASALIVESTPENDMKSIVILANKLKMPLVIVDVTALDYGKTQRESNEKEIGEDHKMKAVNKINDMKNLTSGIDKEKGLNLS